MIILDNAARSGRNVTAPHAGVVTVGRLPAGLAETIRSAVARTVDTVTFMSNSAAVRRELAVTCHLPRCILVDESISDRVSLIEWFRNDAGLFDVPVIALVKTPSEGAFTAARRMGADDAVVRDDWAGIARRVAALDCFVPGEHPLALRGTALVAHFDPSRRRRAGWILRRAGYDLAFASNEQELASIALTSKPRLVVVADQLLAHPDPEHAVRSLRARIEAPRVPVVVLAKTPQHASGYVGLPHTAASVDDGSWEQLLFQVGELTRPDITDLRSSPRTYLSAFCSFRERTEFAPIYALTYNVSRGGMFVRSMDPPRAESTVCIDLRPLDGTRDVVQLRAQVVWVQRPLHGSTGSTPAGFGVRILPEACAPEDLGHYQRMCDRLHSEQFPAPSTEAVRYRRMCEVVGASLENPSMRP